MRARPSMPCSFSRSFLEERPAVQQARDDRTEEGSDPVDVPIVEELGHDRGSEPPRGVHRGAGQGTANHDVDRERDSDGQPADRVDAPFRIAPRAVHDEHEEEGEDRLDEDPHGRGHGPREAGRAAEGRRAEMGRLPDRGREDDAEAERGDEGPEQLGPPVDGRESRGDLPSHERAEGHGGDEVRHAMYDADPRSKPRTNSRLNSEGCQAASGNTRFGKNRVVSPEIWVTRASTPNNVSRIRWDCSRQTRSSTKPREWRYSCRRT